MFECVYNNLTATIRYTYNPRLSKSIEITVEAKTKIHLEHLVESCKATWLVGTIEQFNKIALRSALLSHARQSQVIWPAPNVKPAIKLPDVPDVRVAISRHKLLKAIIAQWLTNESRKHKIIDDIQKQLPLLREMIPQNPKSLYYHQLNDTLIGIIQWIDEETFAYA
jgi:hypothetical protein